MKKLLRLVVLLGVVFALAALISGIASTLGIGGIKEKSVLHLRFLGPVEDIEPQGLGHFLGNRDGASLLAIVGALRRAATDPKIAGVFLDIRSAEVSLSHVQEIEEAMAKVRDAGKWTRAYVETAGEMMGGDAAYALAATAQDIVLSPPGQITLSGLRATTPFVRETLDRLKLVPYVDKRYEYKSATESLTRTNYSPAALEALTALIDDMQTQLIGHMATRRGRDPDIVRTWYAHGPFSSGQALADGLVDKVAYFDEVEAQLWAEAGRDKNVLIPIQRYMQSDFGDDGPTMALIAISGGISRGRGPSGPADGDGAGSDTIVQAFRDARKAKVKGVLFRVTSPGGSYIASDLIRREMQLTREANIPVVVSMGSVAASGGYFVTMGANQVLASPATITGSIGVYLGFVTAREFFNDKLGITFDSYTGMPEATQINFLDPPSARTQAQLSRTLDEIYDDFVDKAAMARGKTRDEMHALAKGRVWSGAAAQSRGLVDALGGISVSVDKLKDVTGTPPDATLTFEMFPREKSPIEMILELLEGGVSTFERLQALMTTLQQRVFGTASHPVLQPTTVGF